MSADRAIVRKATISVASSGANELIAAAAARSIVVTAAIISNVTANGVTLTSASGGTVIANSLYLAANQTVVLPFHNEGWFETIAGEGLFATLSGATAVTFTLLYRLV